MDRKINVLLCMIFSQFYRCFPHPSEVNADDITKLVKRYADPTRPGMVNYVNMHRDIESFEDIKAAKISDVQEPLKKLTKPSYSGVITLTKIVKHCGKATSVIC